MPRRRLVACPACGGERVTKAGAGTWLSCRSCGEHFQAPADVAAAGEEISGGVRVVEAAATRVPQRARPRAKGPAAPPAPDDDDHQVDDVEDELVPAGPPTVERRVVRGGAAFRRARVRR